MKTRTGFVSNSSSSSFILYGLYSPSIEKFAQAAWDYIGETKLVEDGYADIDEFTDAVTNDRYILETYDLPVDVLYYDADYVGVDLSITRNTLIHGYFTAEQIGEIDEFLAKISDKTPSVHEGDYYS